MTVGCLPIYSPRLQDRLGTDKVSGAGRREHRADELVWAGLMTGLHGPVLRFMRVDAQSEHFLSPLAVGRNAHDLKTCGRLSSCVRRSYNANESAVHSRHCRECTALAFL